MNYFLTFKIDVVLIFKSWKLDECILKDVSLHVSMDLSIECTFSMLETLG